jgi:microcystin-dependent protein
MQTTPRLGLRVPDGTIDPPDVPLWMPRLAQDIESSFQVGRAADRPTAGMAGRRYFAYGTSQDFVDDGAQWRDAGTPVGAMLDYGAAGDPVDGSWLLCDGRVLSRLTYAALGTTYPGGDGSTTFAIPDCRGRVTVGPDTMGTAMGAAARLTANATRGSWGGEERHTLTITEMPRHNHNLTRPAGSAGGQVGFQWFANVGNNNDGRDTDFAGGDGPHNTMQPFVVVNKIIRVR